jgi:hypothetical protein
MIVGDWQLAIGCWLLAFGFWLLAFGFWLGRYESSNRQIVKFKNPQRQRHAEPMLTTGKAQ